MLSPRRCLDPEARYWDAMRNVETARRALDWADPDHIDAAIYALAAAEARLAAATRVQRSAAGPCRRRAGPRT